MTKKIRASFTVDPEIWKRAGLIIHNRSRFLENCLLDAIKSNKPIEELSEEVIQDEMELNIKKMQLRDMEMVREINSYDVEILDKCLATCKRIYDAHNAISLQQITYISIYFISITYFILL